MLDNITVHFFLNFSMSGSVHDDIFQKLLLLSGFDVRVSNGAELFTPAGQVSLRHQTLKLTPII